MSFDPAALVALGRRVVEVEGRAVSAAANRLDGRFARAVRLLADASIERGGCLAETVLGNIDATLQTRWERVTSALGQTSTAATNP